MFGTEIDVHPPPDEAGRDRVEALADTDTGLRVDPAVEGQHHLEGIVGQRGQQRKFNCELLADALSVPKDMTSIVLGISQGDETIQLGQGVHLRQGNQMTPAEPSDLAFDATFLMSTLLSGDAEERIEAVMAAHGHESLGLFPIPALQHPGDGWLQVVIADPPRHTEDMQAIHQLWNLLEEASFPLTRGAR